MKIGFVICPLGLEKSETRRRSDVVFRYVIKPALEGHGYTAIRADEITEPGLVTTQTIRYLLEAPLVIADLTDQNPNVFYELAVRHSAKKPVICLVEHSQPIPFDVSAFRIIQIDHRDLDSAERAKLSIKEQIEAIEEDHFNPEDNPIYSAIHTISNSPDIVSLSNQVRARSANAEPTGTLDLTDLPNYQKQLELSTIRGYTGATGETTAQGWTASLYKVNIPETPLGVIFTRSPSQEDACIFLTERTINIAFGRGKSINTYIGFDDKMMSKYHFSISYQAAEGIDLRKRTYNFMIKDEGSKHGTFLNGRRVTEDGRLSDGDLIEAGVSKFELFLFQESNPVQLHAEKQQV